MLTRFSGSAGHGPPFGGPLTTASHATPAPGTVLLVQDNPADVFSTSRILADALGAVPRLDTAGDLTRAVERLRGGAVDVILLDLQLTDSQGLDSYERLRREAPSVPVVILTDLAQEPAAEAAVRLGAQDYLIKGRFSAGVLGRALRYAVERQRLQAELNELSLSDQLTGLYNRRGFEVRAQDDLCRARRSGTPIVLGMADVDGLRVINALHGHLEGDRAIREAAGVLRATFRESDVVARVGGDEFALLLRDAGAECQDRARRRLERQIDEHNGRGGRRWRLAIRLAFSRGRPEEQDSVHGMLDAIARIHARGRLAD